MAVARPNGNTSPKRLKHCNLKHFLRRNMQRCGAALQWFAVRTATGREKLVSMQLKSKGYEDFLPLYRSRRQWSDRTKELELPLFPGYLFCRLDFSDRLPVLIT